MKSCWLQTDLHHPKSFHLHLKNSLAKPIFQMRESPTHHFSTQTPSAVQTHKVPICVWHTKHSHRTASPPAAHVGHETALRFTLGAKKVCGYDFRQDWWQLVSHGGCHVWLKGSKWSLWPSTQPRPQAILGASFFVKLDPLGSCAHPETDVFTFEQRLILVCLFAHAFWPFGWATKDLWGLWYETGLQHLRDPTVV